MPHPRASRATFRRCPRPGFFSETQPSIAFFQQRKYLPSNTPPSLEFRRRSLVLNLYESTYGQTASHLFRGITISFCIRNRRDWSAAMSAETTAKRVIISEGVKKAKTAKDLKRTAAAWAEKRRRRRDPIS